MNPLFESKKIKTKPELIQELNVEQKVIIPKSPTPFIRYRHENQNQEEQGFGYSPRYNIDNNTSKEVSCVKDLLIVNGHQQARSTFVDCSRKSCDDKFDYDKFLINFTSKCLSKRNKNTNIRKSSPYTINKVEKQDKYKIKLQNPRNDVRARVQREVSANLNLIGFKMRAKYKQSSHFI